MARVGRAKPTSMVVWTATGFLAVLRGGGEAPFAEGGDGGFVEAEAGGVEGGDGVDFAGGADGEFEDDGAFVAELAGVDGVVGERV